MLNGLFDTKHGRHIALPIVTCKDCAAVIRLLFSTTFRVAPVCNNQVCRVTITTRAHMSTVRPTDIPTAAEYWQSKIIIKRNFVRCFNLNLHYVVSIKHVLNMDNVDYCVVCVNGRTGKHLTPPPIPYPEVQSNGLLNLYYPGLLNSNVVRHSYIFHCMCLTCV